MGFITWQKPVLENTPHNRVGGKIVSNSFCKVRRLKERGPITTDEIETARNCWIRWIQRDVNEETEATEWRLVKDEDN